MSFRTLRPQTPVFPTEAEHYAAEALRRSELAAGSCRMLADIAYGDHPDQRLDLYLPKTPTTAAAPVMVVAHGGGWTHGYKEWMGLMAPPFLVEGIVFVSISHRLAPDHKYPEPMDDCAEALGWVHRHIAEHGGDPHRLGVGGHSSGGHLFAMVALQPEVLRRVGVATRDIRVCAPLSARLDLDFEGRVPGSVEARHQAMLFADPSEARSASPISQIAPDLPHVLLAWGSRDIEGVARSNERMRDAMASLDGVSFETLELDGDHFDVALQTDDGRNPWVRRVVSLLQGR